MGSIPVRVIKKLLNPKIEELFLVFGSQSSGMSTVVAAAALRKGVFNLTRTGIAAELTAASGGNRAAVRLHLEYHMPFYG